MKCIIVDDQREAVELLVDHVKKVGALDLKMATTDAIEALDFLEEESVDLIFLDVQMPDLTGLDFIENLREKLGNKMPRIIFTTGYDHYALPGYEHGVFDYLLKPISFKRFKKSVDRVLAEQKPTTTSDSNERNFFFADVDGKKVKIDFDDIVYVEGARNYIFIVTDQRKMIILKSMTSMGELLPKEQFMRIHKSYICAINRIRAIKGNEIIVDVKDDSKAIPIGVTYREGVLKKLRIID